MDNSEKQTTGIKEIVAALNRVSKFETRRQLNSLLAKVTLNTRPKTGQYIKTYPPCQTET